MTRGELSFARGDLAGADSAFRRLLEVSPSFPGSRFYLALLLDLRGEDDAALREAQRERGFDAADAALAIIHHHRGRPAESDAALARLIPRERDDWPYGVALAHARRGEIDRAFAWLDRSFALRDPSMPLFIRCDYLAAPLRADPRYDALLQQMNLAD
jgi:tetratricopeptide (TPR) repeat protein